MAKGQVNKGKGKTNKPKLSVKEKKAKKNEKRAAKRNKPGPGPASRDSASLGAVVVGLDLADSCCLGSGRAKTSVARSVSTPETPLYSTRLSVESTAADPRMGAANFLAAVEFQSAVLDRREYKGVMRAHMCIPPGACSGCTQVHE